jgi:hypothetical protein
MENHPNQNRKRNSNKVCFEKLSESEVVAILALATLGGTPKQVSFLFESHHH